MDVYDEHELSICVDCLFLIANGRGDSVEPSWCPESHADDRTDNGTCEEAADNHANAIETNWPSAVWFIALGDTDGDSFSWYSCDTCGSRLGGSRYDATAFQHAPIAHPNHVPIAPTKPDTTSR